jgi:lipid A 3-O-deacylase
MKKLRLLLFCFAVVNTASLYSQDTTKTFRYEITFITDNDDYTFKYTDRYYTNGLFLKFAMALKDIDAKTNSGTKKVLTFELGQQMYNSFKHDTAYLQTLDRPFAGILYLKAGITKVYTSQNVLQWNIWSGVMGPSAKGKEVHRWWHKNFGLPPIYGWETQLNDEVFLNAQASYHHHLTTKQKEKPWYDAFAFVSGTAGNNLSAVNAGLQFKLGAFEKAYQSVAWNTRIQKQKQSPGYRRIHETYFYFEPQLTYQVYNAAIQGGMFTDNKGFYHTSLKRLVYQHRFGILYAQNHWTAQLGFTFRTREAENQIAIENLGTMRLSYRFR